MVFFIFNKIKFFKTEVGGGWIVSVFKWLKQLANGLWDTWSSTSSQGWRSACQAWRSHCPSLMSMPTGGVGLVSFGPPTASWAQRSTASNRGGWWSILVVVTGGSPTCSCPTRRHIVSTDLSFSRFSTSICHKGYTKIVRRASKGIKMQCTCGDWHTIERMHPG